MCRRILLIVAAASLWLSSGSPARAFPCGAEYCEEANTVEVRCYFGEDLHSWLWGPCDLGVITCTYAYDTYIQTRQNCCAVSFGQYAFENCMITAGGWFCCAL